MKNQNKDNLEKFFKESAQNYHFEFNEGDWRKLEAQLDKEMPVAFTFWSFLKKFWPVGLLAILFPVAWYAYDFYTESPNEVTDQEVVYQNSNREKTELPDPAITGLKDKEAENILEEVETNDRVLEDNRDSGSEKSRSNQNNNSLLNANNKNTIEAIYAGDAAGSSDEDSESMRENDFRSKEALTASSNEQFIQKIILENLDPLFINSEYVTEEHAEHISHKSEVVINENHKNKISYYAGLGFSPDFSTVGLGNFIAPGFRWTFIGEVGITSRFLVNTGIVYIKNKYEAYGEDYHAPESYWKNGIVADQAYGECLMLEVPVNIRYNVLLKNRHQLFVSAGASTYFLMKEDYYFHYEQDDPDLPKYWGTDKLSIYPFGIINISLGYQYQLGRKGSIQVEPFIKLPTGGIGWGKVDLNTIGMYFIYKYKIGR